VETDSDSWDCEFGRGREHPGMTEGEQAVERLLTAYQRLDVEGMIDCFNEDAAYHAMSMDSAVGRSAMRKLWSYWATMMSDITCEVHRQLSDGTIVMHERTDRSTVGDRKVETPVAAVFGINNGLITEWREYFDDPRTP
jgi:limonene-1,2-epoxide hydrolase